MAFTQKVLQFQISIATGNFAGGGNTATLTGLRAGVNIANAGPPDMGVLAADIYGMSLSMMNQLTTLGTQQNLISNNTIIVSAGEADGFGNIISMSQVFTGTITTAFTNAQSQPDVSFHIDAVAGMIQAVKPMNSTTMQGSADASTLFSNIAGSMGLQFMNGGVSGSVMNPYLWGSGRNQVSKLAQTLGLAWDMDDQTLAVWPKDGARDGTQIVISPLNGMIGYPAFNSAGIVVKVLFNQNNSYLLRGRTIQVQSDLTPACGSWTVSGLEYSLASQTPRGDWFAIATAFRATSGSDGSSGTPSQPTQVINNAGSTGNGSTTASGTGGGSGSTSSPNGTPQGEGGVPGGPIELEPIVVDHGVGR